MSSAVIHLSRVEIINTGWTLILRGSLYKVYLINSFVGAKEWHHKYPTCADEVAIGKTVLKSMGCCINELIPPPTPPIVSSFERGGVCVYNTGVSSLAMSPIFKMISTVVLSPFSDHPSSTWPRFASQPPLRCSDFLRLPERKKTEFIDISLWHLCNSLILILESGEPKFCCILVICHHHYSGWSKQRMARIAQKEGRP